MQSSSVCTKFQSRLLEPICLCLGMKVCVCVCTYGLTCACTGLTYHWVSVPSCADLSYHHVVVPFVSNHVLTYCKWFYFFVRDNIPLKPGATWHANSILMLSCWHGVYYIDYLTSGVTRASVLANIMIESCHCFCDRNTEGLPMGFRNVTET
jgi:membrane protein YdbS with pleckstrin-like domain